MISLIIILKSFVFVIVLVVTCECQKFLTASDFKNADKLTADEIDRGVGVIDINAEFNDKFFGGDVVKAPTKRKDVHGYITRSSGLHWPNGRVPYEFVDKFSSTERMHIAKAIGFLERNTCVRLVPRKQTDRNYIKFVKSYGCASFGLGRQRYPQELSLAKGCIRSDIIIHELMHALGFMHEFSRPDREKYIRVKYENINPRAKTQFRVIRGKYFGDWMLPFEVKSVMFYENGAGARKRGLSTMVANNGQHLRCQPHDCPTKLDIEKINTVYNCKKIEKKIKTNFLGQNSTKKQLPKENCETLLKWKASDEFSADNDNAVSGEYFGKFFGYVCRTKYNGLVISGLTSRHGCRGSVFSGFPWTFKKYDVLVNPNGLTVVWSRHLTAPVNAISAGNGRNGVSYVMRCAYGETTLCSNKEFLTC